MTVIDNHLAIALGKIARDAGAEILSVYDSDDLGVETKSDNSPLTRADKLSHELIMDRLADLVPDIPVISEEGKGIAYADRAGWQRFFLVDPLDGTKEFIKRNGEFTVNIGLISDGVPVLGIIYVPVTDVLYYASPGSGAFMQVGSSPPVSITVSDATDISALSVAASRSHGSDDLESFLDRLGVKERRAAGSSLKFCLVAEGLADFYPRFGPTWEWDTAAGHAIVREAGGLVLEPEGGSEIKYNKESLLHRGFVVLPVNLAGILGSHLRKAADDRADA